MSEEKPQGELSDELRELGRNLKSAAKAAWESEESRRLQQELRAGLAALELGLKEASSEIASDETRQRVREEVHGFSQRVRSGQVETQLRADLISALHTVNAELKKAARPAGTPDDKA
jgi:hypothetical protein